MGTFRVPLETGDLDGGRYEALEALVDTRATYTTLSGSVLRRLGIASHTRGVFVMADGSRVSGRSDGPGFDWRAQRTSCRWSPEMRAQNPFWAR